MASDAVSRQMESELSEIVGHQLSVCSERKNCSVFEKKHIEEKAKN